jgi:hypothetical protein
MASIVAVEQVRAQLLDQMYFTVIMKINGKLVACYQTLLDRYALNDEKEAINPSFG